MQTPVAVFRMAWKDTSSTSIRRYDHDPAMNVLHIQFHSGRIVSLQGVPPDVVADFEAAESKGKFFHGNLRDQYRAL